MEKSGSTTSAFFISALALALLAAPPLRAQSAPLGGTVGVSLLAGAASPGQTFPVAIVLDLSNATGTCGIQTVPMTLGAYNLGVTYDATAFQYVGVTSCGAPQFSDPLCADRGTFVNCNDANNVYTGAPQGVVCVARLTFRSLVAGLYRLSVLATPPPRGIASNIVLGCGLQASFPSSGIVPHGTIIHSGPVLAPDPVSGIQ